MSALLLAHLDADVVGFLQHLITVLVSIARLMGAKRQGPGTFSWYASLQMWHGSGLDSKSSIQVLAISTL